MHLTPVLTPLQAAEWDAAAAASGRALETLMDAAGRAVAQVVIERFARPAGQGVLVACGSGNNGGDGWVAARALHALGVSVWVTETAAPHAGIAATARDQALADGVRTVPHDGPWPTVALVIDAILGTGARGPLREPIPELLARLIDLELPIVAIDGPTGLDLETGLPHGPILATLTITFGGVRRGHLLARDESGEIVVVDIGLGHADASLPRLVDRGWAADRLVGLAARSHKGIRGRVVIVGGDTTMTGAARLVARAAFGAGAGLVHVIAPAESIAVLRTAEPDVQTLEQEFTGSLSTDAIERINAADVVIIGPGLGRADGRTAFVLQVLTHARAAVIDADALFALKGSVAALAELAGSRAFVCTPHLGEFRTLFPEFADDLETAPWEAAQNATLASHCAVLLKGVPTVVACESHPLLTVAAGNPGLATGGSGDVLSGIIGALLGQGIVLPDAAAMAAQALGEAADIAARRVTARAMRPMDVVAALPDIWRAWARHRESQMPHAPVLLSLAAPQST
ncbi:MAG: NAD(P)H-hydrate dehydratase [Gemmatimonadota bacterium]